MIQKGFPPSNLIAPGLRIIEKDLSFIAPEQTGHRAGLVGFASKGPINIPTAVRSVRELHLVFGQPHPDVGDPYMIYAAEQYLQVANELFVVRVADTSPVSDEAALTASVDVLTAGGPVQIVGNVTVGSGWSFDENAFFRWRLNGVLAGKILVVLSDDNRPSPDNGTAYEAQDLVDALNDQLTPSVDGIEFFLSGSGTSAKLGVRTTFSYGTAASLELVSVSNALYGPSSVVGMGTTMTAAELTAEETQYPATSVPSPGDYDFSGFTAGSLNLQVVVDGTDNVLIDNVVQVIEIESDTYTITEIVDLINDQIDDGTIPGGFVASESADSLVLTTLHTGRDAKLLVKSSSTADTLFGLSNSTASGTSPKNCGTVVSASYACGIVYGSANADDTVCFTLEADSPGIDGNETQVVITNHVEEGSFQLDVYSYGDQVETWGGLKKDPTSSRYVESYLAAVSNFIRVTDNTETLALPAEAPLTAPLQLSGGTDGIPADPDSQDDLLVGSDVALTGLQSLSDVEQFDIDLIAIPGHTSTAVTSALLSFAENRGDCFAIVDSPFGLTAKEVEQWHNGVHTLNDTRFDSNFGALYWPWLKIRDGFNRIDVWVPPSGPVMATYVQSDILGAPWKAPAGINRGILPNVTGVFSVPNSDEKDSMYGNRNAINPIVQKIGVEGFVIDGQKTLQRRPTALDRVNVRRGLIVLKKRIQQDGRALVFEPHDELLRQQFVLMAKKHLDYLRSERAITDYIVQCDRQLNTDDVIDRNELRAKIGVIPTRAAEFIFVEVSVHRTGSFGETSEGF